jgi:hypothetical protein
MMGGARASSGAAESDTETIEPQSPDREFQSIDTPLQHSEIQYLDVLSASNNIPNESLSVSSATTHLRRQSARMDRGASLQQQRSALMTRLISSVSQNGGAAELRSRLSTLDGPSGEIVTSSSEVIPLQSIAYGVLLSGDALQEILQSESPMPGRIN